MFLFLNLGWAAYFQNLDTVMLVEVLNVDHIHVIDVDQGNSHLLTGQHPHLEVADRSIRGGRPSVFLKFVLFYQCRALNT